MFVNVLRSKVRQPVQGYNLIRTTCEAKSLVDLRVYRYITMLPSHSVSSQHYTSLLTDYVGLQDML
jgi:hypothetical protein